MKIVRTNLVRFCHILCMIPVLFMLGSVVMHSQQPLIWGAAVLFGMLFIRLMYAGERREYFFDANYPYIVIAFLVVVGAFQLSKIQELRFIPAFDLDGIYGGAIEWLETGTFAGYYDYYDWFPNNLGGLSLLHLFLRAGSLFTSDYFMIAAVGNEILLLLTYLFISLSARKLWGSSCGVIALVMAGSMAPLLFMTDAFYTDSLSIVFPVLLFYLSLKIGEARGGRLWGWCILSGIAVAFGGFVKSTVFIMALAIFFSFLFQKKWKKAAAYFVWVAVICAAASFLSHWYFYTYHLDSELARIKNTPYSHWVMMGLAGEGGYNPGDYEFTRSFPEPEERDQAIKEEIRKRISQRGAMGMAELYAVKLSKCFGDGTLGLSDFLDDSPENRTVLHDFLLYEGNQYALYHGFCCLMLYGVLLLTAVYVCAGGCMTGGNVSAAQGRWEDTEIRTKPVTEGKTGTFAERGQISETEADTEADTETNIETGGKFWIDRACALPMALCGLILFLMNWEVSPRYITNYVPILILLAAGGAKVLAVIARQREWEKKGWKVMEKYGKEIKIFITAILFRVFVYVLSVCMMAILGDFSGGITFSDFLEAWKRWDSAHYINIAENGYGGAIENGEHIFLVFYPLYPWLMRTVSLVISDIRLCGIFLSVLCFAIGCVFFYRIVKMEFGEKAAENAVALLSVFPFSFFFGAIATESLFFAVGAAFFYYLREHRWGMVAFLGFLACMTKVQGLLLAFAVLVEIFYAERGISLIRKGKWKEFFGRVIGPGCICALMLFGFWVYLLINYVVEGDLLRFMYYQKNHWGNGLCPIWETIGYVRDNAVGGWYTSTGMSLWVPELLLFAVYLIEIVYGVCRKIRPMYLVYLIAFFLLTYSSTWLISAGRYTLSALPLFMLGGEVLARRDRWKTPVLIASAMVMMIYMTGYYSWKQIM